ncbi:hypothetical protein P8452_58446 [Trifolium repens]|nr:hypothetical protein P8452_58446 [Trifolium repens]
MPTLQQQQQPCCEEQIVGDGNFKWGNKKGIGVRNKDTQFYDSFVYDGVEYFLYDCVCFYHTDHVETSIGKLVKMYQTSTQKMIKVVWFFRPSEIRNFFGSYKPCWNELFLASGKGTGVTNRNLLESIIGKCSVVCTSEDKRNPKPSETELKRADFFFKCTFNVDRLVIDDKFPDKIDGIEVEKFFNRKMHKKTSNNLHLQTNNTSKSIKIKIKNRASENVNDKDEVRTYENVSPKRLLDSHSFKKRKIIEENSTVGQSNNSQKKEEFDEKEVFRQDKSVKLNRKFTEVTERPNSPWKERLQKAQESDTLVLLSNLDPSYTSYEVEDLVWHALKEKVEARMIESSPNSNTYYGRALVIFRTKDAAENAMSELNRRCLILEGGRVVIARKGTVTDPAKKNTLTGHFSINRAALYKQSREMRNAVSTSHCSQPNTIEYAMAIEWTKQYYKSEECWKALCEKQMKEIDDVKSKLSSDNIF